MSLTNPKNSILSKKASGLLAAAMALPGVAVHAQEIAEHVSVRVSYAEYRDYQSGLESRMRVHSPQLWAEVPLGTDTDLKGGIVYDSMSGASPYYLNSLSGASGLGVRDERTSTNLSLTHRFTNWSAGLSGVFSDENDYTSRSLAPEFRFWNDDQTTTFIAGVAYTWDAITSSFVEDFGDHRKTPAIRFAVNQVLTPVDIMQVGVSATSGNGYWSDPYKAYDNRPRSREMYAGTIRYRHYLRDSATALQLDARMYGDSWGVYSPSLEVGVGFKVNAWSYRPFLRYMYQERARFFSSDYPPQTVDQFFSADQRLGSFGSIGGGLRVEYPLGSGFVIDASVFGALQDPRLFPGSTHTSRVLQPFYYGSVVVGLTKHFD